MILRTIPLVFKKIGMKYIYNMAASANTATITNLGNIQVAPEYEDYVDHFSVILSRSKGQNLKMCLCSYKGTLTSTISSVMKDTKLQKAFYRYLVANDIPVTIEVMVCIMNKCWNCGVEFIDPTNVCPLCKCITERDDAEEEEFKPTYPFRPDKEIKEKFSWH